LADVFLSYASADRDRIAPIAQALIDAGWSVWWDQHIQAGDDWDRTIERELDACGVVVAMFSETSVESRWVRAEAMFGLEQNKLVPVLLEDVRLPVVVQTVQAISWSGQAAPIIAAVEQKLQRPDAIQPQQIVVRAHGSSANRWLGLSVVLVVLGGAYWGWSIVDSPQLPTDPTAEAVDQSDADGLFKEVIQSDTGDTLALLKRLEEVVAMYPDHAPAWARLSRQYRYARSLHNLPTQDDQKRAARRAAVLDPKLPQAQVAMSFVVRGEEKIAYLEEALRLDPTIVYALTTAAMYYGSDGQKEKATHYYERALELEPDNVTTHANYGQVLEAFGGRLDQGLAHVARASELGNYVSNAGPYLRFQNKLFDFIKNYYVQFMAAPLAIAATRLANQHLPAVDRTDRGSFAWIEIARQLGLEATALAQAELQAYVRQGMLEEASNLIAEHGEASSNGDRVNPSVLDLFDYLVAASTAAYRQGDLEKFNELRVQARDKLIAQLEPYRTVNGYRVANILDIWFSEEPYFKLMMVAWSMQDHALAESLANTLQDHYEVPRVSNGGPGTRNMYLAWVSIIRGEMDQALEYIENAYRAGAGTHYFMADVDNYDVRGELEPFLADPRFVALFERSEMSRKAHLTRLQQELPQALAPDIAVIRLRIQEISAETAK
jgi:hypothetical protein